MGSLTIDRILVANRGEIAARIARTAREMGIHTVLARAEDDLEPVVARTFDETTSLGAGTVGETYLSVDRIIDAARRTNATAIHPGYGFLSERPELAAACEDSGIVFIGPSAETIEKMGSKTEARKLVSALGVPVVPGYDGADQSDATLIEEAGRVGFPVLVKASAGGGGKGMKRVEEPAALPAAIESARREASRAFGDDRLLIERWLDEPRHVEVQILGDGEDVIHLYERDCSIQRRHQKIIEESPAPSLPKDVRERMTEAAVKAARGIGYRNAGTIELIMSGGEFYFLEMNTRLQVEHPVTELVTGVDLVRAQIEIAGGSGLPWSQGAIEQRGHAIEARIYAEDPDQGYLPQTGRIAAWREPSGPGVRVDSGVGTGSEIGVRYDPMLAKVIGFAESRAEAIARLRRALAELVILGVRTNVGHLRRILDHPGFREARHDTGFLERHEIDLMKKEVGGLFAVAAMVARQRSEPSPDSADPARRVQDVWDTTGNWGK